MILSIAGPYYEKETIIIYINHIQEYKVCKDYRE